jgi:PAS domain S-box-containing protein
VWAALALGFLTTAALSVWMTRQPGGIAALWVPSALATCVMAVRRREDWPWLLATMVAASALVNAGFGDSWITALSFAPANVAEVLCGALLLTRFVPLGRGLDHSTDLIRLLLLGAVVPGVVGGLVAAVTVAPLTGWPPGPLMLSWALSIAAGGTAMLPVGLHVAAHGLPREQWSRVLLTMLVAALATGLALYLFASPMVYVCGLLVLMASIAGPVPALAGVLAASVTVGVAASQGIGQQPEPGVLGLLEFQLTHVATLLPGLALAALRLRRDELQAHFDALYRRAPEGILLTRPSGEVMAANPAAQRLLGLSEAELYGLVRADLVDPGDPRVADLAARRARDGFAAGTIRMRSGGGRFVDFDISSAAYRLPSGEMAAHVFLQDATQRLAQQRALEASRDLLDRLAETLPGVLYRFELGPDGTMRMPFASAAIQRLAGVAPEQVRDMIAPALERIHPQDVVGVVRAIEASARDLVPFERDFRLVNEAGEERWLSAQSIPRRLPDGTTQWHGYMSDVTERRQVERQRAAEHQRLELALEGTGIGTWEFDVRSGTMSMGPRWGRMLGLGDEVVALPLDELRARVHPDDLATLREAQHLARPAEGEEPTSVALLRARHADGHWIWLESRWRVVERDPVSGDALRVVGLHVDVSQRVQADEMRAARDRAEAANLAKTQFMSRVSHELRTPLNAVLGFCQLLALDPHRRLDDVQRDQIRHVSHAAEHLLDLINDLLDLSRIESGELAFHLGPVGLGDQLASAATELDLLARRYQVKLDVFPVAAGTAAHADRLRLKQVLVNLMSNAIKYNRRGGWVTVRARPAAGGTIEMQVTDSGRGMSAEQLEHLFEPFNRLGAEASGIEGTGIGLTITRRLVEGMGGRLEVSSRVGEGSTFTVVLNAASEPAPSVEAPQAPAAERRPPPPAFSRSAFGASAFAELTDVEGADGGRRAARASAPEDPDAAESGAVRRLRVLYVEDNPVNVILLQEMTRRRDFVDLEIADSGSAALEAVRLRVPDLLLIDMNLSDMTGLELRHQLCHDPALAAVPCVAVSADAMPSQVAAAREAGFADYLTKPLRMSALLRVYDDMLEALPA